jgi:hypothetical protein
MSGAIFSTLPSGSFLLFFLRLREGASAGKRECERYQETLVHVLASNLC